MIGYKTFKTVVLPQSASYGRVTHIDSFPVWNSNHHGIFSDGEHYLVFPAMDYFALFYRAMAFNKLMRDFLPNVFVKPYQSIQFNPLIALNVIESHLVNFMSVEPMGKSIEIVHTHTKRRAIHEVTPYDYEGYIDELHMRASGSLTFIEHVACFTDAPSYMFQKVAKALDIHRYRRDYYKTYGQVGTHHSYL